MTQPANTSGRANRIAPDGSAHAVAARGALWGNRGRLLDRAGALARHSQGRNWICCVLEFHGRHRTQWQPNRLTELYFLDEATAFAAGHRPCGECRHDDYQSFKAAWVRAFPHEEHTATAIDRHLHADRLAATGVHRAHDALVADLPDGTMIEEAGRYWLLRGEDAFAWSFDGYPERRPRDTLPHSVAVRTPRAIVATMREGYVPQVHPSADAG